MHNKYQPRTYRNDTVSDDLVGFRVMVEETDVFICANDDLSLKSKETITSLRQDIKQYIRSNPVFGKALKPIAQDHKAPHIVRDMLQAASLCNVGPMAAVAGAMAEHIGRELLQSSPQVIVENGGDVFLLSDRERIVGVYTGEGSEFHGRLAVRVDPCDMPCGICTSSATIGHSLSFGSADAVVVMSASCALADACATAICNMVNKKSDINKAISYGRSIKGIQGLLIVFQDCLGVWGKIKFIDI
jgi:uncharacterized protein